LNICFRNELQTFAAAIVVFNNNLLFYIMRLVFFVFCRNKRIQR